MPNQSDPIQPQNPGTDPVIPDFQTTDIPPIPTESPTPPVSSIQPPVSSDDTGSAAPPDTPPMITSTPKKKFGTGKIIATILGFLVLVGGIAGGVILTQQKQIIKEKAYEGTCSEAGATDCATAERECTIEKADKCKWVDANNDCRGRCVRKDDGGGGGGGDRAFSCKDIKAYSAAWAPLSASNLSKLKKGDAVNFCAKGEVVKDLVPVEAARFTINGTQRPETTNKRPGGDKNEFCDSYTIPPSVTTFNVQAEVKVLGKWK